MENQEYDFMLSVIIAGLSGIICFVAILLLEFTLGGYISHATPFISLISGVFLGMASDKHVLVKAHESCLYLQHIENRNDHQNIRSNFAAMINGKKKFFGEYSEKWIRRGFYALMFAVFSFGFIIFALPMGLLEGLFKLKLKIISYKTSTGVYEYDNWKLYQFYIIFFCVLRYIELKSRFNSKEVELVLCVYPTFRRGHSRR